MQSNSLDKPMLALSANSHASAVALSLTASTQALGLPTITVTNQNVNVNVAFKASSLIASVTDPNKLDITFYDFRDNGSGGGYFTLSGVKQASGSWITIAAPDLSKLEYVGGASAGSESVDVAAWDGFNWSYLQTATITTKAVALPQITVVNQSVSVNASIQSSSLIASVYDPYGYAITSYDFRDNGLGGGYLSFKGVKQVAGDWINVAAGDLSALTYVGGNAAGNETIDVAAWDGLSWSYYQTATVTTKAAALPVITVANQSVNAGAAITASSLISAVTDPGGFAITYYDFRDNGGGGGYFSLNGIAQASGSWISVSAADLGKLSYIGASLAGSETVDVAAWDGTNWSYYQTASITTKAVSLPQISVNSPSLNAGASILASTLIASVTDPAGYAITSYDFRDNGSGGGYFSLDGVKQISGDWITIAAVDMPKLRYVGGNTPGQEQIDVAAWDGHNWSYYRTSTVTTVGVALPVIVVNDQTVNSNATLGAGALIKSVSDPNGYSITSYDFRDSGSDGGYFSLSGVKQASGTWITVTAADLPKLSYVGGSKAGTEAVDVAAWDGYNWSYYQTATVTTKAVALPVIVLTNQSVVTGAALPAKSLIVSATDPSGLAISAYDFRDDGAGGGYLSLNGIKQASDSWITVNSVDLAKLNYVGGAGAGSESLDIAAWNGVAWSYYQTATVTTKVVNPAVVTAVNQTVATNASVAAEKLIAKTNDPNNFPITSYEFRDNGPAGGYFQLNGVKQASGAWIVVSAADLPKLNYVGGSVAGSETIDVAANNGYVWSNVASASAITISSASDGNSPKLTVLNQSVNEFSWILASSLVDSITDPNHAAITYFEFRDNGSAGGYFLLNGVRQDSGKWITASQDTIKELLYYGGASVGSETVDVVVWNGSAFSNVATSTVSTTQPQSAIPSVVVQNQSVSTSASVVASALIVSVSDPGGYPITAYDFRDNGIAGGYLSLNGVKQASGNWITVKSTDLPKLMYIGGGAAGTETVDVAAWDGLAWSNYQTATVTTVAAQNLAPTVTLHDLTLSPGALAPASSLIVGTSDPGGYAITSYRFRDDGGTGSSYFSLAGVRQAGGTWITVSSADLPKLSYVGGSKAGIESVAVAVYDNHNWSDNAAASVTTTGGSSNSVLALLLDPGVRADVTAQLSSSSLNYMGMLKILGDVATGGVTATEFADLKTLVSLFNKADGIQVTPYLYDISSKLINGDAANAYWTGGAQKATTLGNLKGGSSETQLNELIQKWFLGGDLPAPVFKDYVGAVHYVADSRPLYNSAGVPSKTDINQLGILGDCYLLSSLAEIAQCEPATIKAMLTDNGNSTWGVQFFIQGRSVYVTVNNSLPVLSGGGYAANTSDNLWSSLIEKAYVQLNEEPGYLPSRTSGNVYKLIDGGWADPITQITGRATEAYDSSIYSAADWAAKKNYFVAAIQQNLEVDFASWSDAKDARGLITFEAAHMFAGIGYDNVTGNFIIRNPWGTMSGQNWNTEFESSIQDLQQIAHGQLFIAKGTLGATPANINHVYAVPTGNSLIAPTGNVTVNGNGEIDTVVFDSSKAGHRLDQTDGKFTVTDQNGNIVTLASVQRLSFSDTNVALDLDGHAGQTARILGSIFGADSVSNRQYVGIGLNLLDGGMGYADLMNLALQVRLGKQFSNADEVRLLYRNLVGQDPAPSDLGYWTSALDSGQFSKASLAVAAAGLDLNAVNIDLMGLSHHGLDFGG